MASSVQSEVANLTFYKRMTKDSNNDKSKQIRQESRNSIKPIASGTLPPFMKGRKGNTEFTSSIIIKMF